MKKYPPMTASQASLEFTKDEALAIQAKHLAEWEKLLKPEVFEELKTQAMKYNDEIDNPFYIPRGNDLDDLLHKMRIGE